LHIDFRKTFDKINHQILFQALQRKGVNGIFLFLFKKMNNFLYSCVKVRSTFCCDLNARNSSKNRPMITEFVKCNIETRQGDKSSSTIFAPYIDELAHMLREKCNSGIFITQEIQDIVCLMFADVIASCVNYNNN
jgi:hypothetical protein